MKIISTQEEYNAICLHILKIIHKSINIPNNVYKDKFKYFLFLTFDEIFLSSFFDKLTKYLKLTNRNEIWIVCLDPDAESYYKDNFNYYSAMQFSSDDSPSRYIRGISRYPENSPADSIPHNGNIILYLSPDTEWAIYADRDSDISICAFSSNYDMENFRAIFSAELLAGVEFAAHYAFDNADCKQSIIDAFCQNYSNKYTGPPS